jgi:hypothetical protein
LASNVLEDAASKALPCISCVPGICRAGAGSTAGAFGRLVILMYYAEIRKMSGLSSMQIQALVRDMDTSMRKYRNLKQSDPPKFYEKVMKENEKLYNEFPSIFEMHIQGKLDGTFFEMLKLRQKMEKGEMTEDEASRIIGQKLFDRYVAPVIGPTPVQEKPMSYTEYYNQFK